MIRHRSEARAAWFDRAGEPAPADSSATRSRAAPLLAKGLLLVGILGLGVWPPSPVAAQEPEPHIGYGVRGGPMVTFDWHGGQGSRAFEHVPFTADDAQDLDRWLERVDRLVPGASPAPGVCAPRPDAIEIGNEPNLDAAYGWGAPPDAAAYTRGLCAAYARIKERAPEVVVVSAGLAPTGRVPFRWSGHVGYCAPGVEWCPSYYQDDLEFLREMLRAGAGDCLDAIGYHPYGFAAPFDAERGSAACGPNDFCFRGVEAVREIAYQEFAADKPVWATEFGWLNDPRQIGLDACWNSPDFEGRRWQVVSPEEQARNLRGAFQFADEHYPWMQAMFVFNHNYGTACDHRCYNIAGRPAEAELQAMAKRFVVPAFSWSDDLTLLMPPGGGVVHRAAIALERGSGDRLSWSAGLVESGGFASLVSTEGDACSPVWVEVDPSTLAAGTHRAVLTLEMTHLPMVPIAARTQPRTVTVVLDPTLAAAYLPVATRCGPGGR